MFKSPLGILTIFIFGLTLLVGVNANKRAQESNIRFDPVIKKIEGWTIHVDPTLIEGKHAEEGEHALKMLANHLQRISILVQGEALKKLKTCQIWIEHSHPSLIRFLLIAYEQVL